MPNNISPRALIIALAFLVGVGFLFWHVSGTIGSQSGTPLSQPEPLGLEDLEIEPTPPVNLPPPPEKPFSLPEGSVSVDEYAYVNDGGVFFKSLTGKAALNVGDARAESFVRLSDFLTYTNPEIERECGGDAQYAYYGDGSRVYFYQIWRTETFRASKVEGVKTVDATKFSVLQDGTATDGATVFTLSHTVIENGTCRLLLTEVEE